MSRSATRSSTSLVALVYIVAACSSTAKDAETADTVAAPVTTAAAATSCWLQEGTAADAALRASPLGEVRFSLGSQEALLCYSRPSAKGRTVMGALVPFGEPWRLGANEATTINLPFPADIGGVAVEPGTYSIYAVPGQTGWEFFVNRQFERWGIPISPTVTEANVGSFRRPVTTITSPVEQFTFRWEGTSDTAGQLVMEWATTQVAIPVQRRS